MLPTRTSFFYELIDTLWNVNILSVISVSESVLELIDTLWNVNKKSEAEKKRQVKELIDTLWNVNYDVEKKSFHDVRINRYIMECKCHFGSRSRI